MSVFQRRTKDAFFNQCHRFGPGRLDYGLADLRLLAADAIRRGPCPYCQTQLTDKSISFDHAIPICRGGTPEFANLTVCCLACNTAKGPLTQDEYRQLLALLASFPRAAAANTLARLKAGARCARFAPVSCNSVISGP